jgi:hypothetical protein
VSDGGQGERGPDDDPPERQPIPAPDHAPQLGAAFTSSEAAARAWGAPVDDDTAARRRAAAATPQAPDGGPGVFPPFTEPVTRPEPMGPRQEYPPRPGEPRTLTLPSTGDLGIDAMLMCRQVFESLPDYERRRLLTYLADRYAGL